MGKTVEKGFRELGNVVGDLTGANRAAKAAQGAASAREREARSLFENVQRTSNEIRQAAQLAANNPDEIQALRTSLRAAERQVARDERLIENIDPAIKEAAGQALSLLRGEEAAALAPVRKQRERQRRQLENTLRERLGPGALESTAGIQALSEFDAQSSMLEAQTQQNTLSGLLGTTMQGRQLAGMGQGQLQNVGGLLGQQSARNISAVTGPGVATLQGLTGAGGQVVNAAGSQFVGEQIRARSQQSLFNTIAGATIGGLTGGLGSAIGGGLSNLLSGGKGGTQQQGSGDDAVFVSGD